MTRPVLLERVELTNFDQELDAREVTFGGRQVQGRPAVVVLGLHVLVGIVEPVEDGKSWECYNK